MVDKIEQIGRLLEENDEVASLLKASKSIDDAVEILKKQGIEVTKEEFIQMGKMITSEELSEDMLEMVSGGSWKGFWKGVKSFFQGFLDAF